MSIYIYESSSLSARAAQQRFERVLRPMLDKVLTEDADKRITIGKDNNLYIADVPIGDWRFICEFKFDERMNLHYRYKNKNRAISFGMYGLEECRDVQLIFELDNNGCKVIYDCDARTTNRGGLSPTPQ